MSLLWTTPCLGALVLSSAIYASGPGSPRAAVPQQRDNLREFFVLTDPGSPEPVGVMALRKTAVAGGVLLEQDLCFPDGVRVFESERWRADGRRFIWREWGHPSRTGRTWILEGRSGATSLDLLSWAGGAAQRVRLAVGEQTLFPLEMLERMRAAECVGPHFEVVCPLRIGVQSVLLRTERLWARPGGQKTGRRVLRMTDGRGESLGQWIFEGKKLLERRWPSGRRARTVEEGRHDALLASWFGVADGSQPRAPSPQRAMVGQGQ